MKRIAALVFLGLAFAPCAIAQTKNDPAKATTTAPKAPAAAKPAAQKEWKEAFDDWVLACAQTTDGQKSCAISQSLSNTKTRQLIGALSIGKDKAGKLIANLQTPLGFAVSEGIKLSLDGQSGVAVPVKTCLSNGCLGIVELDQNMIGQLRKSSEVSMTLQSLQATPVVIKFSPKGVAKALDKLMKDGT